MPRDQRTRPTQQQALDERASVSFRLVCFEGPNKGSVFSIPAASAARVLVGQSSACAVRLLDPLVSRRHLALDVQGPSLHVTDLGSRNGTYANDVAIVEANLWGGETLRLGGTAFRVELDEEAVSSALSEATRFGRLVGTSVEMRSLFPFFEQLASSALPVLIEGETGTGKELLAECLHEAGPRASGPLLVLDSAQLSATSTDAVLFGDEARPGVFEQADGGTLLLDEVGEFSPDLQRKLLRVLERSEVQRGGSSAPRRVDVRIIATTRLDLDKLVQDGAFREDLYYRLVVSRVELPPLRKRPRDILPLARHFWTELGGGSTPDDAALVHLTRQPWPGNVRELRNRIARLVTFGDTQVAAVSAQFITVEEPVAPLADSVFSTVLGQDLPLARAREIVVSEFERAYVARVLAEHDGHIGRAAAASGLARRYFQLLRAKRLPRP